MKCNNCTNEAEKKVLNALKSPLFFVIAILLTVCTGFRFISGNFFSSLSIIALLLTIFTWMVYARAEKGICDVKNLRVLSGIIFVDFVKELVGSVIGTVTGVFLILYSNTILQNSVFLDYVKENMKINGKEFIIEDFETAFVLVCIFFLIFGITGIFISIFGVKSIHSFVKSVYKSAESGKLEIKKRRAAEGWLMAFGIISVIAAVLTLIFTGFQNLLGLVETGAFAATYICLKILIKKNFNK